MGRFRRGAPPLPAFPAFLILCGSFAWGLPAGASSTPPAEVAPAEPPAKTSNHTVWLYAGLGPGTNGVGGNASISYKYLRYSGAIFKTFDSKARSGAGENAGDWGILFGWSPIPVLSLSVGVARVEGSRSSGDLFWGTSEDFETFGVPVEVQFSLLRSRIIGLGTVAHANFNKDSIFGSLTFGVQLGKLK